MPKRLPIVLLHGSANGSYSWGAVRGALAAQGATVWAPDMLGYGRSPAPGPGWTVREEVAHLRGWLDQHGVGPFHLVAHSLGTFFGLHMRLALGARVSRLTLVEPVLVSVLRVPGEEEALGEMEAFFQRFMRAMPDHAAAARVFVEHWSGAGTWSTLGDKARVLITKLAPRLEAEMVACEADRTWVEELAVDPVPTSILVGESTLLAPRAVSRILAQAFDRETIVVPGAGHMIPLTHPAAIVDALGVASAAA
jgi:pimeloyl-ACP methyl ester carboxylesterase